VKGALTYVMFEVKNLGDAQAGNCAFQVKFHAAAGVENCDMHVASLEPGGNQFLTCPVTINANPGNYPVKATVDVGSEVAESNENNNVMELTLTLVGN